MSAVEGGALADAGPPRNPAGAESAEHGPDAASGGVPAPAVSVVIPSVNGAALLAECLAALEPQVVDAGVEVVVADRCGARIEALVGERFPWVRMIAAAPATTIPALRDRAIEASRAPLVAVIEDHCMVSAGWLDAVRAAGARLLEEGFVAVGGPIENGAEERLRDRAAFLCEYSHVMATVPPGEVDAVPGNNVAYTRAALDSLAPLRAELWEFFLHTQLRRSGGRFLFEPGMRVRHKRPFGIGEYTYQRFVYSRSFAAMRSRGDGRAARWLRAGATLALPPVLMLRIGRAVFTGRRDIGVWLASLPLLSLFTASWAAGEMAGYLFGSGDSLEKVK